MVLVSSLPPVSVYTTYGFEHRAWDGRRGQFSAAAHDARSFDRPPHLSYFSSDETSVRALARDATAIVSAAAAIGTMSVVVWGAESPTAKASHAKVCFWSGVVYELLGVYNVASLARGSERNGGY